ncbi:hypothetical protein [Trichococcus collinsii]|nr:hypothetical protein [Trichococcus collinsii]
MCEVGITDGIIQNLDSKNLIPIIKQKTASRKWDAAENQVSWFK